MPTTKNSKKLCIFTGKGKYITLAICFIWCKFLCYKSFIQTSKGIVDAVLKQFTFGVRYNDSNIKKGLLTLTWILWWKIYAYFRTLISTVWYISHKRHCRYCNYIYVIHNKRIKLGEYKNSIKIPVSKMSVCPFQTFFC